MNSVNWKKIGRSRMNHMLGGGEPSWETFYFTKVSNDKMKKRNKCSRNGLKLVYNMGDIFNVNFEGKTQINNIKNMKNKKRNVFQKIHRNKKIKFTILMSFVHIVWYHYSSYLQLTYLNHRLVPNPIHS